MRAKAVIGSPGCKRFNIVTPHKAHRLIYSVQYLEKLESLRALRKINHMHTYAAILHLPHPQFANEVLEFLTWLPLFPSMAK